MKHVLSVLLLVVPLVGAASTGVHRRDLGRVRAAFALLTWWWLSMLRKQAAWPVWALLTVGYGVWAVRGPGSLAIVWAVALTLALAPWRLPRRKPKAPDWWSESSLTGALRSAGLIRGDAMLSRVGAPSHSEDGTAVAFHLPAGVTVTAVKAKREAIAAYLRVRLDMLDIDQRPTDPASVCRIRVRVPVDLAPRVAPAAAALAGITDDAIIETSWRVGVPVGRDDQGRTVAVPTYDVGAVLVGGRTGSGKTTLLRLIAIHYALDPDALVFLADGKGSVDDWGPLRDRCSAFVMVQRPDASEAFLALLRDVAALIADRNGKGGRHWPGVLVLLEEFAAFRAGLTKAHRDEMDRLITRIVQTCRSANVLVVIAAQRPSANAMSTDMRAQAGVGVCLPVSSATDAEMVLGHPPTLALPKEPGDAIVRTDKGEAVVHCDRLTDAQWCALCERASVHAPDTVHDDAPSEWVPIDGHDGYSVRADGCIRCPDLVARAHAVVAVEPGQRVTPQGLYNRLAEEDRPSSVKALSQGLRGYGWAARKVTVNGSGKRMYVLADLTDHLQEMSGIRPGRTDGSDTTRR